MKKRDASFHLWVFDFVSGHAVFPDARTDRSMKKLILGLKKKISIGNKEILIEEFIDEFRQFLAFFTEPVNQSYIRLKVWDLFDIIDILRNKIND